MPEATPIIELKEVSKTFGEVRSLSKVNFAVYPGEIVGLLGDNGAGKSTLVNTLCGLLRPAAGRCTVRGRLALVPEGRHLFAPLTVDENLRLGAWRSRDRSTGHIYELLPSLGPLRRRTTAGLSGGEQQMVALGRALMGRPDVLVIDEMSLGLAPKVVADLADHLRERNTTDGLAVLLIEQNARLALDLCSRAYVLEAGRVTVEGRSADLAGDPAVAAAYLGLEV